MRLVQEYPRSSLYQHRTRLKAKEPDQNQDELALQQAIQAIVEHYLSYGYRGQGANMAGLWAEG